MKPINHRDFTCAAFRVFERKKNKTVAIEVKKLLIQSSDDEDNAGNEFFQRAFNWHFYNNGGHIKNKLWRGRRTSEKRIGKLIDRVDEYLGKFEKSPTQLNAIKLLDVAGRLAHHIQDMRTPTHVVPVYHGPTTKDAYETFIGDLAGTINVSWSPDAQQDDTGPIIITDNDFDSHAADISAYPSPSDHPLHKLHIASAELALKYLRNKTFTAMINGQEPEKPLPLSMFWLEHPDTNKDTKHQGFGDFGPLGNKFGETSINSGQYKIKESQYLAIYRDLLKQSVLDTLVLIEYIEEKSPSIFAFAEPLIDKASLDFQSDYDEIGECPPDKRP